MRIVLLLVLTVLSAGPLKAQSSNAARYLAAENLVDACGDAPGRFGPGGLIEADFDADGRTDLLVSHEAVRCGGDAASSGRSLMCGMQVCSVRIYLRRGQVLALVEDFLGGGVTVNADATPPVVSGYAHGGAAWSRRWSGDRFR